MTKYDAKWVERFYDEYGLKEWDRLVRDSEGEIKLHVHRHYLEKYVHKGDRVLEIGAGAGRFTQILAELGAKIVVADISEEQLELNRTKAVELGFDHAVEKRLQLDMCDIAVLDDETFDVVVCYGGPLSYVFEKATDALGEVRRVLTAEGIVLFSVMSLWGTMHKFLNGVLALPAEVNRAIVRSGDLCPQTHPENTHHCHMFRAKELEELLNNHSLSVLEMAASNCISTVSNERLDQAKSDPAQWQQLLEMELEACREPGCLDMGTHTIAIARKEK